MLIDPGRRYQARISTSLGEMTAELYARDAPNTVNSFVFLARERFYDNVLFYRIVADFLVQTGDPTASGRGGPGYRLAEELNVPYGYTKGTLGMSNAGPNMQGSQFFICHGPATERLPKNYTVFGKLTTGLDVLDQIAAVPVRLAPTGERSFPVDPPLIRTITIIEE